MSKTIYVIRTSGDGVQIDAYTNIKAVHERIMNSGGYKPVSLYYGEVKYSYANLVKRFKDFTTAYIQCEDEMSIEVTAVTAYTKY